MYDTAIPVEEDQSEESGEHSDNADGSNVTRNQSNKLSHETENQG
jgi:hypothetical protein